MGTVFLRPETGSGAGDREMGSEWRAPPSLCLLTITVFQASRCGSQLRMATPCSSRMMTSSQFLRMSLYLTSCSLKTVTFCRVLGSAVTSCSVPTRQDSSGQRRAMPPPRACTIRNQHALLPENTSCSTSVKLTEEKTSGKK